MAYLFCGGFKQKGLSEFVTNGEEKIMGNLGMYQMITIISKRVGGPVNLLLMVAAGGYITGRTVEWAGKSIFKALAEEEKDSRVHTVKSSYVIAGNEEKYCELQPGDQYRILARDGDAVLIKKIGDQNNPYYVSKSFLENITE